MSTQTSVRPPGKRFARRVFGGALATLIAGIGAVAVPGAASAAEVDSITSVTVAQSTNEVEHGTLLSVDAEWAAGSAKPADTFTLHLPTDPKIEGVSSTFTLEDQKGANVGTCSVSSTAITCTYSDYVLTHRNVTGTLKFWAVLADGSTKTEAVFTTTGGATYQVTVPTTGTPGGLEWPEEPLKTGRVDHNKGAVAWAVLVPAKYLLDENGKAVTITDTYDPALTVDLTTVQVYKVNNAGWTGANPWGSGTWLPAGSFQVAAGQANSFTVTIAADAVEAGYLYAITYDTKVPAGTKEGTVFKNQAVIAAQKADASVQYWGAGGTARGNGMHDLAITKKVVGDNAVTSQFGMKLECVDQRGAAVAGYPKEFKIDAESTQVFEDLDEGTTCTLTETDAKGAADTSFSMPNPIVIDEDSPTQIDLTVTNIFSLTPVGSVLIGKEVVGSAAPTVSSDTEYEIAYSFKDEDGNEVSDSFKLTTNEYAELYELPVGTVITLSEKTPPTVSGVSWGTPSFVVDGKKVGKTATITVGDGTQVFVNIVNTASTPVPPGTKPTDEALAWTGAQVGGMVTATLLLLAGGSAFVLIRRRARA